MKASILSAVFLFGISTAAYAADMPEEVVIVDEGFNWSGVYVGAHAGYGWGNTDSNLDGVLGFGSPLSSVDIDGFVGGVHVGYNFQQDSFVFGIEGDFDGTGISGSETDVFLGPATGDFDVEWQGSVRARLGYAMDRFLVYGTGGVAFARGKITASIPGESAEDTQTHTGWTLGAGAEYAFTNNWIGRVEYRYTDFSDETYSALTDLGAGSADFGFDENQVLVGFSYKF